MLAGAGVFRVAASWAFSEIQVELLRHGLCVGCGLDLHDRREIVAGRQRPTGDERVAGLGKRELGRGRALTRSDGHDLFGRSDGFSVVAEEGDLHLAVGHDEEFRVGLDRGEQTAAIRRGNLLLMRVVVIVLGLFVSGRNRQTKREGRKDGKDKGLDVHDISFSGRGLTLLAQVAVRRTFARQLARQSGKDF